MMHSHSQSSVSVSKKFKELLRTKSASCISGADIDTLIEYAVHSVNFVLAQQAQEQEQDTNAYSSEVKLNSPSVEGITQPQPQLHSYSWLVANIRTWRNPAMTDRKSVVYLFKQILKHIDVLHSLSITSRGVRFTEDDRALYIAVVEEYHRLLKDVYAA